MRPHSRYAGRGRSTTEGRWVHERGELYRFYSQRLFIKTVRACLEGNILGVLPGLFLRDLVLPC